MSDNEAENVFTFKYAPGATNRVVETVNHVTVVIPGNTRIGVYLRRIVDRGHIERGEPIDLKRVYEDDQQACAGDGENQHRAAQERPSFSFHHEYRALRS